VYLKSLAEFCRDAFRNCLYACVMHSSWLLLREAWLFFRQT